MFTDIGEKYNETDRTGTADSRPKKEDTMNYQKLIKEQLGENFTFKKAYNAFENGELRIIATDEQGYEHRYILVDGQLTEKP